MPSVDPPFFLRLRALPLFLLLGDRVEGDGGSSATIESIAQRVSVARALFAGRSAPSDATRCFFGGSGACDSAGVCFFACAVRAAQRRIRQLLPHQLVD